MKKICRILTAAVLSAALAVSALAASGANSAAASSAKAAGSYSIQVNGKSVGADGCVMVPLRKVGEALGFKVVWKNGSVYLDDGQMHTTATIGVDRYLASTSISGAIGTTAPFSLGVPPYVANGTAYVPAGLFEVLLGNDADAVKIADGKISFRTDSGEQIANPFVDCATVAEAEKLAGVTFRVPEKVDGYSARSFQAIENSMIQAVYTEGDDSLLIRKGADADDVSGDYTTYSQVKTVAAGSRSVTLKGENGLVNVAVWTEGGHAFAVDAQDKGMTESAMLALVASVG